MTRVAGMILITLLLLSRPLTADGQPPVYSGVVVQTYSSPEPVPVRMPTAVSVAPDGAVYVCDGVNDRIVVFEADGTLRGPITTLGDETLSRPLDVHIAADGRLWIADTGNARVLIGTTSGMLEQVIRVPRDGGNIHIDITAARPTRDGRGAWLVDNDRHLLLHYNFTSQTFERFGGYGRTLEQYWFPYLLAVADNGDTLVTDVINGRIVKRSAAGEPVQVVGGYGVHPGQFYRPKGIALDADENIWVSDSSLGVVQVFSTAGRFRGVLRNPDGTPWRFAEPVGLTFGPAGNLYVVELGANRVQRLRIRHDATAPPPTPPPRQRVTSPQPVECTACHFEWMDPLAGGEATELANVPPNSRNHPFVSRSEVCLSCHDGGVTDSRRRVWLEHGHQTGITPPADMEVPARYPLVEGKLVCRTCHSAHTRGGSGDALAESVFLRVDENPAELCATCHQGYIGTHDTGMHPIVPPPPGTAAHGAPPTVVTCLGCHGGHGAFDDLLLADGDRSNDLCLHCHAELTPDLFGDERRSVHGRTPKLTAAQRSVADSYHTRVGPNGELLCLTCHVSHRAPHSQYLLAFDHRQPEACTGCHAEQQEVLNTAHDLRASHPDTINVLDLPIASAGPCSACHTAHRSGQPARPTPADPIGRCTNCHHAGGLAAKATLGDVNHSPEAECISCHEPHTRRFSMFLRAKPEDTCRTCHAEQFALHGGPHDVKHSAAAEAWPDGAHDDTCLACHQPHGNEKDGLFTAGLARDEKMPDAACIACHPGAAPHATGTFALLHTSTTDKHSQASGLPLAHDDDTTRISCVTCHNTHASGEIANLVRTPSRDATQQELCLSCHPSMRSLATIGHAPEMLRTAGMKAEYCQPCHVVHARRDEVDLSALWPRSLESTEKHATTTPVVTDRHCTACHHAGGGAPAPAIADHPAAEMYNSIAPTDAGFLPLFNAAGEIDPAGRIGCRTCHFTHGRAEPATVATDPKTLSQRELRARKWHIRSYATPNVCTGCHGFDALRRFMYFHDPARRQGPIDTPAGAVSRSSRAPSSSL